MKTRFALLLLLPLPALLTVPPARARAATVVADCTAAPVAAANKMTRIDLPGEDVVVRCPLAELPRTAGIAVVARSIVVDGTAGGAIHAEGKGMAVSLEAAETILLDATSIAAANRNGDVRLRAGAGVTATATTALAAGELLQIECTDAGCPIELTAVGAAANRLFVLAKGTVGIHPRSTLMTHGPTDLIRIVSAAGDVLAGGGLPLVLPDGAVPDVLVGFERAVMLQAAAYCACSRQPPNTIVTSLEGSLQIEAPAGGIDLAAADVRVGETIDLTAAATVDLTSSSVQNCGPKRGRFRVAGTSCVVAEATLLDDAPDTAPELSCLMEGAPTIMGTCSDRH